jgi:hypothetical protein
MRIKRLGEENSTFEDLQRQLDLSSKRIIEFEKLTKESSEEIR